METWVKQKQARLQLGSQVSNTVPWQEDVVMLVSVHGWSRDTARKSCTLQHPAHAPAAAQAGQPAGSKGG